MLRRIHGTGVMGLALATVFGALGCGSGSSTPADAGTDATITDAGHDAAIADAGTDAGAPTDGGTGPYCILTYSLGGTFRIGDTVAGLGDGTFPIGADMTSPDPGTLVLRVPDAGGQPGDGSATILYYQLHIQFSKTTPGVVTVDTDVTAASPGPGESGNTSPLNAGTFQTGAMPTISWGTCTRGVFDGGVDTYTPDVAGTGPGCLSPYKSVGTVFCDGSQIVCSFGKLDMGSNAQNDTWNQPLPTFTFSSDLSTLTWPEMELPNRTPSRTFLTVTGTLDSMTCGS